MAIIDETEGATMALWQVMTEIGLNNDLIEAVTPQGAVLKLRELRKHTDRTWDAYYRIKEVTTCHVILSNPNKEG